MKNELLSHSLKLRLSAQIDTLCNLVRSENRQHRTDLNDTLEDVFCKVINIYRRLHLQNLNSGSLQEAGLDLGDTDASVCYQVTAESSASKIHDCLDQFEDKKWYKKYEELVILFANEYITDLSKLKLKPYSFDPHAITVLVNKNTLKADIAANCTLEQLQEIVDYLDEELSPLYDNPTKSIPIIHDIVEECSRVIRAQKLSQPTNLELSLHIKDKITLNFENPSEADQVSRYMRNALIYSTTINEVINNFSDLDPAELEEYMMDVYNRLEAKNKNPMEILLIMFDYFVPPQHKSDLSYMSWSRRFVLKYFENCTIFKRSKKEIEQVALL